MNNNKIIVWILRIFLWSILSITLIVIIGPIYQYSAKPYNETKVYYNLKESSLENSFEWLEDHKKLQLSESPELIILNSEKEFDDLLISKVNKNTLIIELLFNEIYYNQLKLNNLRNITGVDYEGYIGKTYFDLSDLDRIPENVVSKYEILTGEKWSFVGEGIIIRNDDIVIVLEKGTDYKGHLQVVDKDTSEQFTGYFEVTSGTSEVLAEFQLNTTDEGTKKLKDYNISNKFPALYMVESSLYDAYYFAGNFSDTEVKLPYNYEAISSFMKYKLIYDRENNEKVYWKWFYPIISKIIEESHNKDFKPTMNMGYDKFLVDNKKIVFKNVDNTESPFFVKGINLGAALPGKTFTEFPMDKNIYLDWFNQMGELNVNTVRIYTLLPPSFYEALYEYNLSSDQPLYLLQEIWPEEHPFESDYLNESYNITYKKEIEYAINAVHGNINIPKRDYRAYGLYRYDVSEYLLSYLVGREMEPEEVKETDRINEGYEFEGEYFYSEKNASPTEAWLASACDYALKIENDTYNNSPLVAIVSWPTLDDVSHDSEWNEKGDKSIQYNDSAVVDIDNIGMNEEKVSGFFGAYHIYPNYPDFMNNDKVYADYYDDQGSFRYGGYLKEFMSEHNKYPALVAEYGLSTSMYTAHINPDGFNHGGISEIDQAKGMIRMTDAIIEEGYAGAVVFEWMDEWVKKTWTTEPYMIPFSRNQYWHNTMDPEQNYGILANDSIEPILNEIDFEDEQLKELDAVYTGQNTSFIYLELIFNEKITSNLYFDIAISTKSEVNKDDYWEFLLKYSNQPKIVVNPGYNWLKGNYKSGSYYFDLYEELIQLTNNENTSKDGNYTPFKSINIGELRVGSFDNPLNHIEVDDNKMRIRIPYGLLGISDPSSNMVLSDEKVILPTLHDMINTKISDDISYKLIMKHNEEFEFEMKLKTWTEPEYESRKKNGFEILSDYFKKLN